MTVKELIEELSKFNPEYEVKTFADYNESGTGAIDYIATGTWDNPDEEVVMISFDFDGVL